MAAPSTFPSFNPGNLAGLIARLTGGAAPAAPAAQPVAQAALPTIDMPQLPPAPIPSFEPDLSGLQPAMGMIERLGSEALPPEPQPDPALANLDELIATQRRINAGEFDAVPQAPTGDPLLPPGENVDPQQLMDYVGARQQRDFREQLAQRLAGQNAELDARIARGPSANPIPAGLRGPDDLANRLARMPEPTPVVPGPDESVVNAARDMSAQIAAMPKTFQPETGDAVPTIDFGSPEYQQYLDTARARIATGMNRPEMRAAGVPDVAVHLNSATNPRRQPSAEQRAVMKEAGRRQRARADQADTDRATRNEAYARMQFLNRTGAEGLDALNRPGIEGRKLDIAQKAVDNENAQATSKLDLEREKLGITSKEAEARAKREGLALMQNAAREQYAMKKAEIEAARRAKLDEAEIGLRRDTLAKQRDENLPTPATEMDKIAADAARLGIEDRKDAKTKAKQDELIARLTMDPSLPLVEHQARMIAKMAPGPEQDAAIESAKAQKLARLVRSWRGQTTFSPVNRGNEDDEFRRQLIDILGVSPESADRYVEQYFPFSRHFSFFGGNDPLR